MIYIYDLYIMRKLMILIFDIIGVRCFKNIVCFFLCNKINSNIFNIIYKYIY